MTHQPDLVASSISETVASVPEQMADTVSHVIEQRPGPQEQQQLTQHRSQYGRACS